MTPDKVHHNGFSENLGTDFIAIDVAGTILCRASTEDAVRRAVPDAAVFFTGADFENVSTDQIAAVAARPNDALAAIVAQVDPAVLADYDTHVSETLVEAMATGTAFTRVTAEGIEHVASKDVLIAAEPEPTAPVVDGSAFDRDGDGRVGGSRPKASRQRKPGGK